MAYLRDTAEQAGLRTRQLLMTEVGWNQQRMCFVDNTKYEDPIRSIFKLYPWELMLDEAFAPQCLSQYKQMRWIEPIWKLLLSNKGILPVLWKLYPGQELLVEAHVTADQSEAPRPGWIRKPMHSREGAHIVLINADGERIETEGPYLGGKHVDQRLGPAVTFQDEHGESRWPVCGMFGGSGVLWAGHPRRCGADHRQSIQLRTPSVPLDG